MRAWKGRPAPLSSRHTLAREYPSWLCISSSFASAAIPSRRADELRDGGSLYWVIRGEIMCRQRILDVRPFVDKEGVGRCHLVLEPKLVLVEPRPWRAFQGWRYLMVKDAPRDLDRVAPGAKNMPEALRRELRELGLL